MFIQAYHIMRVYLTCFKFTSSFNLLENLFDAILYDVKFIIEHVKLKRSRNNMVEKIVTSLLNENNG